jgi:molybdopterin-guanine dinucleotide biosynthesis protein A
MVDVTPCGAAVLVGGLGSRMGTGTPKPLLALGAGVVLDCVLARIAPQVNAVCLCAHDASGAWQRFGLPVVLDGTGTPAGGARTDGTPTDGVRLGPLAGIVAGLGWAEARGLATLLIVPGDTPFVPLDLLARLGEAPAVAEAGGRVHHLVCHLPVMSRPVLAAALARGHSRVGEALEALGARRVAFADEDAFLNINTPQDYRQARERIAGAALSQSPPS